MRPKNDNCFSPISSYKFIIKVTVCKSGIILTITVAMVTNMAAKNRLKKGN